jgi:hypothetical protein
MIRGKKYYPGNNARSLAILTLRQAKLQKILNSGKIENSRKGVERNISELEIEKYGFQLDKCENELTMIRLKTGGEPHAA